MAIEGRKPSVLEAADAAAGDWEETLLEPGDVIGAYRVPGDREYLRHLLNVTQVWSYNPTVIHALSTCSTCRRRRWAARTGICCRARRRCGSTRCRASSARSRCSRRRCSCSLSTCPTLCGCSPSCRCTSLPSPRSGSRSRSATHLPARRARPRARRAPRRARPGWSSCSVRWSTRRCSSRSASRSPSCRGSPRSRRPRWTRCCRSLSCATSPTASSSSGRTILRTRGHPGFSEPFLIRS